MKRIELNSYSEEVYLSESRTYDDPLLGRYLFVVNTRNDNSISGVVYEITEVFDRDTMDVSKLIDEDCIEKILDFYFTWDWCCHIQTDTECMTHFCGPRYFNAFSSMILELKELVRTITNIVSNEEQL